MHEEKWVHIVLKFRRASLAVMARSASAYVAPLGEGLGMVTR